MTKKIVFPNVDRLMPHQIEVILGDPHRFKVLLWHRRARKTTTAINEIVKQAFLTKGVYWHLFPTYAEAKNAIWREPKMLFSIIPPEIIKKKNETELVIEFINGSIYQLIGADNPDRLRGAGPMGCVFDEYDLMKDDVWPIVEPILRQNGGWAWFVGTPKGKGKLYDLVNRADDPRFSNEWKAWILKASTSGIIKPDELEQSKLTMPATLYNQEWECEFLEGEGSVFRNVRAIADAVPLEPISTHYYVMGVDLAKVQDFTVITVYDRETNMQVFQDRFQTLEWPFQKKRIKAVSDHYNRAVVILDATGIGDPIADDLARAGVPIEPFKITNENKKEIIEKLSIYIEQKRIHILPITDTLLEFDNFSYEIGPSGRIFYQAREGYHDDCFVKDTFVLTDKGNVPIQQLKVGDMVMTRQGLKPVAFTRSSIKKVIRSPLGLTGTKSHPVITKEGNVTLDSVCASDTLYIWNEKQSCIEEKSITGIQTILEDSSVRITGDTTSGSQRQLHYTGRYGSTTRERYLRDLLFIIRMETPLTMLFQTLKSCLRRNMPKDIPLRQKGDYNLLSGLRRGVKDFTYLLSTGKINNHLNQGCVLNALQHLMLGLIQLGHFVQHVVSLGIGEEDKEFPRIVYNIQVDQSPEYFANNVLVHNCVISHALAVWNLQPLIIKPKIEEMTSVQQSYLRATGRLKEDIIEDVQEQ